MSYRDKILSLARLKALLPTDVAKALQSNSILAGAMLSELVSKGALKISNLKVGGSKLYYVPGKEVHLLSHLGSLNEKDRQTVNFLKEQRVVRDKEMDPLTRVSLAQVKDFAKPLIVQYDNKEERFYKWFAVSDDDAKNTIRLLLEPKKVQEPIKEIKTQIKVQKPKVQDNEQKVLVAPKEEKQVSTKIQKPVETEQTVEVKKQPNQKPKQKVSVSKSVVWDRANHFFAKHKIVVQETSVVKKHTDFDLIVQMPSPVGNLQYYCKIRGKKRVTDADLSAAYVQGQIRKLPTILLTDGELTKKAKEVLGQLKGLTVTQL